MKSFFGAGAVLLILLVIAGVGRERRPEGRHGVRPGDIATFRRAQEVPISSSQVDLRHYLNAVRHGEEAVRRRLVAGGSVRLLVPGTRVKVGHMSGLGSMVTVLDRDHRGFRGWVPTHRLTKTR